jgi:hypothetical protein
MLNNCKNRKTYYVHNLTFETFVFIQEFIKNKIKFEIISANKIVYSLKIYYKTKIIKLKCSYRITLLPLNKLSELCEIENKELFPYGILNEKIEEINQINQINQNEFKNIEEYKL